MPDTHWNTQTGKPPEYPYIPVAGKYFCTQSSAASLAWTLLINTKRLHLNSLGIKRRQLPAILKSIIRFRHHTIPGATDTLLLPVFGQLCIRVHRGYKVINFSSLTATKVFDPGTTASTASGEINSVRDAASLDFAPKLIEIDPQSHWYTETFIPGERGSKTDRSDPASIYRHKIADHLHQMILLKPVLTQGIVEYLHAIRTSLLQQLAHSQLDGELTTRIQDFIKSTAVRLGASDDTAIYLGFTHGDFSFVNFLYKENHIAVIDWESAKQRSVLQDLYNYFLTELYYRRTQSNLLHEIDNAISMLSQRLAPIDCELASNVVAFKDAYRWIYYLERMHTLLDREPSTVQANVIGKSIDVFEKHESCASGYNATAL